MKKIAVLGGGGTGKTLLADLTLAGHDVKLWEEPENKGCFKDLLNRGGIELKGAWRTGLVKTSNITTDIREALEDASLILVSAVASRHERFAELCAPCLVDGQTILIGPGNTGSLIFANKLKELKIKAKVNIAEMEGNYYSCRLTGPAEVLIAQPIKEKYVAAFPAQNTTKVIEAMCEVFTCSPATNILETTLNTPNVVIHLAACIPNASGIERSGGNYYLYREGLSQSALGCIEALYAEKKAIFNVLGYTDRSPVEHIKKVADPVKYPELDLFRGLIGPTSMTHRYISEDATTGVSLLISLGELTGIPTPVARGLVTLASTINHIDYLKIGRNLNNLGLANMDIKALNKFLHDGRR